MRYNLEMEPEGTDTLLSAICYRRELVNEHGIGVLHTNDSPSWARAFEEFI